jgi:hypothetical protein
VITGDGGLDDTGVGNVHETCIEHLTCIIRRRSGHINTQMSRHGRPDEQAQFLVVY